MCMWKRETSIDPSKTVLTAQADTVKGFCYFNFLHVKGPF